MVTGEGGITFHTTLSLSDPEVCALLLVDSSHLCKARLLDLRFGAKMMINQSFSQNRRLRGSKTKRILQLSVLLIVVIWLAYQAIQSNDKKTAASNATKGNLSDGHIESFLGRKGGLGYNDEITSETEKEGVNFEESGKETEDDKAVEQTEERAQDFTFEDKHEESQENINDRNEESREEGNEKLMDQGNTEEEDNVKSTNNDMDNQGGNEEASSQNSGDPTSHDIVEENQYEHMNSETNEVDDRHRVTTEGGEIVNESKEDSSEHSVGKGPDVSDDQSETRNGIHDFTDQNGVPESEVSSLNETDKGKFSEGEDTLPGSVAQSKFNETTSMAADSNEGPLSITELSDNADQRTKKEVDLPLSDEFKNKTDASTDNVESRREEAESDAHSSSEAEPSGDSTTENSAADIRSTGNAHDSIDLSSNSLNSSVAADESKGGQDNILMPTDNEFIERKTAESQESVDSKVENTDNSENTKLEASPDGRSNESNVRTEAQPADDIRATESSKAATVESSFHAAVSPNQSGELTGSVSDVEQRKEEF